MLHRQVYEALRQAYPLQIIKQEQMIKYDGSILYIDILMPALSVAIECDGSQHEAFSKFFHGTRSEFESQKERDKKKEEWATEYGYSLVRFSLHELSRITPEYVAEKIKSSWVNNKWQRESSS